MTHTSRKTLLLTPGPLTVSDRVRGAMMRDWGARDPAFVALTRRVIDGLLRISGADARHAAIPLQGSGTFAVEAMLRACGAGPGKTLILVNGAYGRRMADICRTAGLAHDVHEMPEDQPVDPAALRALLGARSDLSRVAVVHCETTSGLLNPIEQIAGTCHAAGRALLIDAMSSFGALPVDINALNATAIAASSNKCLQGVPGIGFVLCRRDALVGGGPVVLDLAAQLRGFDTDGQWRFTPPTHVVAALAEALDELADEGGSAARLARYRRNVAVLSQGMRALGFVTLLPDAVQAPIIVSFREPEEAWFDFQRFYDGLDQRGFMIYAGKMRALRSFRVGAIGQVFPEDMERFLEAVKAVIAELRATG